MMRIFLGAALIAGAVVLADGAQAQAIDAVRIEAWGQRFEPMQNITPTSPSRHVSDYRYNLLWSPAHEQAREDWRLHIIYPFAGDWTFSLALSGADGNRTGRDGWRPGEGGAVPPARVGAEFKDIWLSNPTLLTRLGRRVETGAGADGREVWLLEGIEWTLWRDPGTGLIRALSVIEGDPLFDAVENRVHYSDWREVSGSPFPFRLEQFINGQLIRREVRSHVAVNPEGWAAELGEAGDSASAEEASVAGLRNWGLSMSQFFLRRAAMGAPADTDQSLEVDIAPVGDGLYQLRGSSHHNLIIEGPDGLLIVDAVWYPRRSHAILAAIKAKWPDKPLRYVVLSHHHLDHTGGLGPFADSGATIVVSEANRVFFGDVLADRDAPPPLLAVGGHAVLDGVGRRVELYTIPNSHADGMLAVYIPDRKTLFNTDLYSPGRPAQNPVWVKEFSDALAFYGLDVATHVGGHGFGTKPQSDLDSVLSGAAK